MDPQLLDAIEKLDYNTVLELLPDLVTNENSHMKGMVVASACQEGLTKLVEHMFEKYTWTEEEKKQDSIEMALYSAVKNKNPACVRTLQQNGIDLNRFRSDDLMRKTPLHVAIDANDINMVENLLIMGADPNVYCKGREPPVHIVARCGNNEMLKVLIGHGGNVNLQKNNDRNTPLHVLISGATEANNESQEDSDTADSTKQYNDCIKTLVENGAAFDKFNESQMTAIMLAVNKDYDKCLDILFEHGLNFDYIWPDDTNDTIFHRAIRDYKLKAFLIMMSRASKKLVDTVNAKGDTPLHLLAINKNYKLTAQSLLRFGPDLSIRNTDNKTAYDIAIQYKNWKVAELFKTAETVTAADKEESEKEENKMAENTDNEIQEAPPRKKADKPKAALRRLAELAAPKSKKNANKAKLSTSGNICDFPDINVELLVPPDAVKRSHGCSIQVKKWNSSTDDKLNDIEPASDVFEVLPYGQEFEEDVVLKFPLTVDHLYDANGLDVMCSETTSAEPSKWQLMSEKDKNKEEASCMFWDGSCYVNKRHFNEIFVKKSRSDKAVLPLTALLFAQYDEQHHFLKLIVTCVSTDQKSKEYVQQKYGTKPVDDQPILLHQQGKHLQFLLKYKEKEWEAQSIQEQLDKSLFLTPDSKMRDVHSIPHVTFYLDKKSHDTSQSEVSVVICQKMGQKLGRESQKSYFSLKYHFSTVGYDYMNPRPTPYNAPTINAVPAKTLYGKESFRSKSMVLSPAQKTYTPADKLSISGRALQNCLNETSEKVPFILDKDFRQYLKPLIQVLNRNSEKLKEVTASLGMVVNGEEEIKLGAQFVLNAWILRQRHSDKSENNDFKTWVHFLDVLMFHEWEEASEMLILALEKQRLKYFLSFFINQMRKVDVICKNMFNKDLMFEDQYADITSCSTVEEKVKYFIVKVLLKAYLDCFSAFKKELLTCKYRDLLQKFCIQ